MKKVIIRGTGQKNGSVIVNDELELEDKEALELMGGNKDEATLELLNKLYPGVKFDPKKIGVNVS
tara:strand:- start:419 stop:613 length:195 start_codon:yes stop_codon:yes gene_type:complete